jgi:N-acetylmuramoyl-L-alanine amidase
MIALVIVLAAMVTTALEFDEKLTASSRCQPPLIKIALDIGHDRSNPGAISATGVTEFSYNLALAHSVIAALQTAGFNAAFLIGESGVPLSLKERIEIANDHRADLLLSLHHDSVQSRYLSEWTVNAALQRYSDRFHGYSLFISGKKRARAGEQKIRNGSWGGPSRRGPHAFSAAGVCPFFRPAVCARVILITRDPVAKKQ